MLKIFNRLQWKLTLSHFLVSGLIVGIMLYGFWVLFGEIIKYERLMQLEAAVLHSIVYETDGTTDLDRLIENSNIHVYCAAPLGSWNYQRWIIERSPIEIDACETQYRGITIPTNGYIPWDYGSLHSLSVWDANQNRVNMIPRSIELETDRSAQTLLDWALNHPVNPNNDPPTIIAAGAPSMNSFGDSTYLIEESNSMAIENGVISYVIPIRNSNKTEVVGAVLVQFENSRFKLIEVLPGILMMFLTTLVIGFFGSFLIARGLKRRIALLQDAAAAWATGHFTPKINDHSHDELGQLGNDLNQMVDQLNELVDTRSMLAGAETRNRLARDLHDAAKQQLFAAGLQLDAVNALLDANPIKARTHLSNATALTQQAQGELNAVINELRPIQLQEKGLFDATRETVLRFARQQDINATFDEHEKRLLSAEVEVVFFRLLQEALANVAKHSNASQVRVTLNGANNQLTLTAVDNGQGFDLNESTTGFGLHSMKQRIEQLGGEFKLESGPKIGTSLSFQLKDV